MNEPEVQLHIKSEIQEVETPPNVIDHPGSKEVKEPIAYDNQNNSNLVDNTLVKTEDKPNKIQCEVCLKEFQKKIELVDHLQSRVPPANNYKCCACGKCFKDNSQLSVHGRKHTGEKPYKCKECGKCFSINGNLSKHMRTHTGERRFECATCGRKFMQYAHLEDHMKIHSGDRPYTCGQCHSAFKTKARLRKHVKSHDDTVPKRRCVRCHICNQAMQTSTQLVGHMMNHSDNALNNLVDGQIAFPCQVCEKKFKNLFLLRNHLKIHDGIRAFICPICQKTFVTASQLRRHENTHIGHRPFACNQCERSFGSHQNLKRHLLTHTGVKPYVCKMCDKGFLTLENMTRHLRTHTGEKPYSCDVCGRSFAHSTTAKEHRRLHTGDKPFGCTMCNKRFPVNKTLYRHMRASHPDYYETFKKMDQIPLIVRREIAHNFDQDTYQEAEYVNYNGTIKQEIKTEPEEIPEISPQIVKIKKKRPYVRKGGLPPIEIKVEELPQVNQIQSEVKLEPYDKDLDLNNMTSCIKTEIKTECVDEVNSFHLGFHNHFMYMSTNEDLDKDIKDTKLEFKESLSPLIEMKEEIEINIHNII